MASKLRLRLRAGPVVLLVGLAGACSDGPVAPDLGPDPRAMPALQCTVDVLNPSLTCSPVQQGSRGMSMNRIVGGQDIYVKLSSTSSSYDVGTGVFSTYVSVQNLTRQTMGTDGTTISGVKVFFSQGPATSSGTVALGNAQGPETFMGTPAYYYQYGQTLSPLQISEPQEWRFVLSGGATSFTFKVLVSAATTDEGAPLLGPVWNGQLSSTWSAAGNWSGNTVPDATTAATVPIASQVTSGTMPVLTADAGVLHLRVGTGSTLGLGGFTIAVGGNVDATGAISNGTVAMSGTGALLRGNLPALSVTGSTFLQGAAKATGAVSVTGSLTVADSAFSIAIP